MRLQDCVLGCLFKKHYKSVVIQLFISLFYNANKKNQYSCDNNLEIRSTMMKTKTDFLTKETFSTEPTPMTWMLSW